MRVLLVSTWQTACGIAPEKLVERIWVAPSGCWVWVGAISGYGYGQFSWRGKTYRAHRLVYEAVKGPNEAGLDHLCRNKRCVNPDHLEPVSARTNTLRGTSTVAQNAAKTHCYKGHPLTCENLRVKAGRYGPLRVCRACTIDASRRRFDLFKRLHPKQDRDRHWQGRKSTDCRHCATFLQEVRHGA